MHGWEEVNTTSEPQMQELGEISGVTSGEVADKDPMQIGGTFRPLLSVWPWRRDLAIAQ